MSQSNVERVMGRLVTDEGFRRRFWEDSAATLAALAEVGCELNPCERHALRRMTRDSVESFVATIDPRIQKTDIHGGEE